MKLNDSTLGCGNVSATRSVGAGIDVGAGVGVGVGVGTVLVTKAPLFQINFLPLFTHVNFLPAIVVICPAFLQLAPAFTAACALRGAIREIIRERASRVFFMGKVLSVIEDIATT
jgi:hypothetical protein